MKAINIAKHGSWKSLITSELIASKTIGLMDVSVDGNDVYWLEMRPEENGRYVLVRHNSRIENQNINYPPFGARTCVHEYGGASYVIEDDTVFFSNFADQRVYKLGDKFEPKPVSRPGAYRYADGIVDKARNRLIIVREIILIKTRNQLTLLLAFSFTELI